jgi:uncharacterized protein (DUF3084 family)
MLATIAPLPPPPHLLGEDLDVKRLAAVYTILGIVSDPKAHMARLTELGDKLGALVDKQNEIRTAYDQLVTLKNAVDQAMNDHAAAVAQHQNSVEARDREHQTRTDALNDKERALATWSANLQAHEGQLKEYAGILDDRAETVSAKESEINEKYQAAAKVEADTKKRGAALEQAEADYRSRLQKLKQLAEI